MTDKLSQVRSLKKFNCTHAYNPSTLGGRGGWITRSRDRDHPGQQDETPVSIKNTKISWAWWFVPVVPATLEAEAGELLEPSRWRLRWAEIVPLHSSLGNKSKTPSQKKKETVVIMVVQCLLPNSIISSRIINWHFNVRKTSLISLIRLLTDNWYGLRIFFFIK